MKAVDTDGDGRIQYSGMCEACVHLANMADTWNENFEPLSSKPKNSFGSFSRVLIAIIMVSSIKQSSNWRLSRLASQFPMPSLTNFSERLTRITTEWLASMSGGRATWCENALDLSYWRSLQELLTLHSCKHTKSSRCPVILFIHNEDECGGRGPRVRWYRTRLRYSPLSYYSFRSACRYYETTTFKTTPKTPPSNDG